MISLDYRDSKSIYEQIVMGFRELIVNGILKPDEQLPSVRELAVEFGVNPNTVARTYERLTLDGTVTSVRGVGYFVAEQAYENIIARRRKEFYDSALPLFVEQMHLLGITPEEITKLYNAKKHENIK